MSKKPHNNYSTKQKRKTIVAQLLLLVMVLGLAICLFMACGWLSGPTWKPDVEYPMTNLHIEWNYPGRK